MRPHATRTLRVIASACAALALATLTPQAHAREDAHLNRCPQHHAATPLNAATFGPRLHPQGEAPTHDAHADAFQQSGERQDQPTQ
jgi:hypothetical protein